MSQFKPSHFQTRAILFCWLAILSLAFGCTEPPPTSVLRFGLAQAPDNLDPRFATDATSSRINRLLYASLVDFDDAAHPIPSLADWEQRSPTHYRFVLRKRYRTFHDNTTLKAQDVKSTYDFILNPKHASPHRATLSLIKRIETPTDDTVDFFLHKPDALFPSHLVIGILPGNLIQKNHVFPEHPIGSGPFSFVNWLDDTRLQLRRQRDGQLFEFLRIPNPTVRTLKLLAGEIDMMQNDLPPELVSYLARNPKVRVQRERGSNFAYLGFNMEDPIVGQENVRKAIFHAIDRESIIRFVLGGGAAPANALFPPQHWVGHPSLSGSEYNPELARSLLQEAGFNTNNPTRLIYKTSSDPFRLRLATIIQDQLSQVGIHLTIESHDWGTFYGDIKAGRFQMYSLAWVGVKTPDIFHYIFHSDSIPPHGANRGRFVNPHIDDLIERAEATQDLGEKRQTYRRLQVLLLQTLPYIPLWYEDHVFVASSTVEGYHVAPDGNYDGLQHIERRTLNNMSHATLISSSQPPIE
ncbi:MAG: ABC transporter substrate-binding protein [Nitrospirota bacterium]|nr:MAG: ABC transporter substrate-binding protein [Nitrospirota bacterium]